ncbi:MAG: hypothetical protein ACOC1F_04115 [Myxococcota bacterium]
MNSKFVLASMGIAAVLVLGACSGGDQGGDDVDIEMPGVNESPYPGVPRSGSIALPPGNGGGGEGEGEGEDLCAQCMEACLGQGDDPSTCQQEVCADSC